jgi:putative nucleotidyltransferase with HDIG domain
MSYAPGRRHRSQRGATLGFSPTFFARAWELLRNPDVLVRVGLFIAAALLVWVITGGGTPPIAFRTGDVPARKVVARVDFQDKDEAETQKRQEEARATAEAVYLNNPRLLEEVRQGLTNNVVKLAQAADFDAVQKDPELQKIWSEFVPPAQTNLDDQRNDFGTLKTFFTAGMDSGRYDEAIKNVLQPLEKFGILKELKHKEGSQVAVIVRDQETGRTVGTAKVDDIRLDRVQASLPQRIKDALKVQGTMADSSAIVARLTEYWLAGRLPETLAWDQIASEKEAERAKAEVPDVMIDYKANIAELAPGGKPLGPKELDLLRLEHEAWRAGQGFRQWLSRSLATMGMYLALSILCGFYIYHRRPRLLTDLRRYTTLLSAIIITIGLAWMASQDAWRAEIIPILLFAMTAAIAYEKELALLLTASVAMIVSFSLQQGLAEFVILMSGAATAILLLRRIRSRTKLIYVGFFTGVVVMLTTIGVGTLVGRAFGATSLALSWTTSPDVAENLRQSFYLMLLLGAAWFGFCSLLAGVLMTGLLPFIERMFDVQTDISLLELGDVQHPLLQELVRRAPGTYNHSINVASIAETASEAIEANGLLVRVGAYFHDIGKMLKPAYFVENQGPDGNRHESLQPAMSTLVIIAHVKDGADLARRHHLPQSIIDFIEQHHGTTLVEYFFRREAQRLKDDPDAGELDETTFRYPGPKPQTKEAAVLMLADVVESASRALVDPTPARIESLVHDLAMKRLLDGQFDECGLTLSELRTIEDSLVKSLTAVYHGRVKYPEHQTV